MSKKAGEFYTEEYTDANLIYGIPELKLGDDWNVHRACLENCFSSKCINDEIRKISILIASLKNEAYQTMLDLCKPELPYHKTFQELCEIMEKQYLEFLVFKKRREFSCLKQFNLESVTEWFTRVQKAAAQCNFSEQSTVRIKDQFVTGMEEGEILEGVLNAGYAKSLQTIVETALKKEQEFRPIEKLPEEILIHIFNFLPIADRIRVERVKKSWRKMTKKSWIDVKELKAVPVVRNFYILKAILIRCGKYLKNIDVKSNNYPFCVLPLVADYCPKIQSISCNKVSVKGLKKLW